MSLGSEIWYDTEFGSTVLNETTVPNDQVFSALQDQHPEVAALVRWSTGMKTADRAGGIFERDKYLTPENIFDQFKLALYASENDDVVAGIVESTEAMAFNKMGMSCEDEQQEDIWNQILEDINFDSRVREMWREAFIVSQFYAAVIWGRKTYKVSKKTKKGNQARKQFNNLLVPTGMTILDPLKVLPIGNTLFGSGKLVYLASRSEMEDFNNVLAGKNSSDQIVSQLIKNKYEASESEKKWVQDITGARDVENLYLLNPENVWRFTATKPDYQRFASVRMKSIFEVLDIKTQVRQMDRAYIIGGTNFIILVKKGSDKYPAKQEEVNQLATQIRGSARVPVIIGDHRIEIEIITPNVDMTLKPERYNTLDARITARLYQLFMTGNYAAGTSGDDSIKLARVVARGMESRRQMIYNEFEKNVIKKVFEKNDQFTEMPVFNFHPKRIALDFDNNLATYLQDLRDRGDISRDTLLSEVDIDQDEEARKRKREEEIYDDIFTPTNVPFSTPNAAGPGQAPPPGGNTKGIGRRQGGNSNGGGANRQSGVSQPGRGTVPQNRVKNPGKGEDS